MALSRELGWKGSGAAAACSLALATGLAVLTRAFGVLVFSKKYFRRGLGPTIALPANSPT